MHTTIRCVLFWGQELLSRWEKKEDKIYSYIVFLLSTTSYPGLLEFTGNCSEQWIFITWEAFSSLASHLHSSYDAS